MESDRPRTPVPVDVDLLTTEDVMDILLEDANLRRRAATCVLPVVNTGAGIRFRRDDIEQWIRKQRRSDATS